MDVTANFSNPDNDPKGLWTSKPWIVGSDQSGSTYTILSPTGKIIEGEWMGEESTYLKYLEEGTAANANSSWFNSQKMNLFELFKQKCDWTDEEVRNNVRVI